MLLLCRRFCNDERGAIKSSHPDYTVGDIAKELGKKWGEVDESTKSRYEAMAEKDKARYERVRLINNSISWQNLMEWLIENGLCFIRTWMPTRRN